MRQQYVYSKKTYIRHFTTLCLCMLSVVLIIFSKFEEKKVEIFRSNITYIFLPVLETITNPVDLVQTFLRRIYSGYEQNETLLKKIADLEKENADLQKWKTRAQYWKTQTQKFQSILNIVPDQVSNIVTARVTMLREPYQHTLFLNAGLEDGVSEGQIVMDRASMIGKIFSVGKTGARIRLVTDSEMRIPVFLIPKDQDDQDITDPMSMKRALLAGDNTSRLYLIYSQHEKEEMQEISIGDRVVTSGKNGQYLPGLMVGLVASIEDETIRVQPFSDFSKVDYAVAIDFEHRRGKLEVDD